MLAWSQRTVAWLCLALVVGASCSVFPDEATLPAHPMNSSGSAGQGADEAGSNAGGHGTVVTPEGGAAGEGAGGSGGSSGSAGSGGLGGSAGTGGSVMSLGGAGGDTGGAGGEGGGTSEPVCVNPRTVTVDAQADTWIGAAKPTANHDSDKKLFVAGGDGVEQRALIRLTLPPLQANARLLRARLRFHLESNADLTHVQRRLGLHQLVQPLQEGRATWLNWGKNGDTWSSPGGDYNEELARTVVPADTSSGNVDFVVTATVNGLLGQAAIPLSLIVLEIAQAPAPPAELAFTSTQGNASLFPQLLLDYCDP